MKKFLQSKQINYELFDGSNECAVKLIGKYSDRIYFQFNQGHWSGKLGVENDYQTMFIGLGQYIVEIDNQLFVMNEWLLKYLIGQEP